MAYDFCTCGILLMARPVWHTQMVIPVHMSDGPGSLCLSTVWTNVGLLPYACNIQRQKWMLKLELLFGRTHWNNKHVLGNRYQQVSNNNRMRVSPCCGYDGVEGVGWSVWTAILITSIIFRGSYLWYANFLSLGNNELVTVSTFISFHVSRKQIKIQKASVLMRLHLSLGSWHSVNW